MGWREDMGIQGQPAARFIGIDPGVGGAIAMVEVEHRVEIVDLPTTQRFNGRKRIQGCQLLRILRDMTNPGQVTYIGCEAIHAMPVTGSIGVFSQGSVTGAIEATLDILQAERAFVQCRHVNPYEWKKYFGLLKTEKEASRQLANRQFGSPPCLRRKGDHDRAEAALIALYMLRQVQESLDRDAVSD